MPRSEREPVNITSARPGRSIDINHRETRYLLSMLVRVICFILAVVITTWVRWVFVTGAVFLPYVAVVLANATDKRAPRPGEAFTPEPFGELEHQQHATIPGEARESDGHPR